MSISRLSAGAGYQYLLRTTACADTTQDPGTALTGYYTASGNPPGRWYGAGLSALGDGSTEVRVGDVVTEDAMSRLYGDGCDPVTGAPLGRGYRRFAPRTERVASAVAALPENLTGQAREAAVVVIERVEAARPVPKAVAGFDLTFSARKSVSVLWALADPTTRQVILDAHHQALSDTLAYAESAAVFTRIGTDGAAQVATGGLVAAVFDHWDTRTGDPQLHSHVVIANKVQGPDGVWRSVDSRGLHHGAVTLSELYDNLLADHLAAVRSVSWSFRDRGPRRTVGFELDGIDDALLTVFATRTADIDAAFTTAVSVFTARHGRVPTPNEVSRLRQHATLATRPAKTHHSLADLLRAWATRARAATGREPGVITAEVLAHKRAVRLRHDQLSPTVVQRIAVLTLERVADKRTVFHLWHLRAEAHRVTRGLRMASAGDRIALVDRVVTAATTLAVRITPEDPVPTVTGFTRPDGASAFTRAGMTSYTHPDLLAAEARLLDTHLNDFGAPVIPTATARHVATSLQPPRRLGGDPVRLAPDQVAAIEMVATSGRRVEVLVGPAGTGKTTTLTALRTAWETTHGRGSVIGLAPSATAAHELSEALQIPCENTAKWIHESTGPGAAARAAVHAGLLARHHDAIARGDQQQVAHLAGQLAALDTQVSRWAFRPTQLVIIDEASLADTRTLDQLRAQAAATGAKLVLVGDHAQLGAVAAGGGFELLATTGHPAELVSLWRFTHRWEANATRALRRGDPRIFAAYTAHQRIHHGHPDVLLEQAYTAWAADTDTGLSSVLVASDTDTVTALNIRAHNDRVATGEVTGPVVALGDEGCGASRGLAGVGDRVLTRRNERQLRTTDGSHVRNGTLWTISSVLPDGSLTVAAQKPARGHAVPAMVTLPAGYVADYVDLGYAITTHRAQGLSVDTAHVLAGPGMTRPALYVGMTRGSSSNNLYLPTQHPDEVNCNPHHDDSGELSVSEAFAAILANTDEHASATQAITDARQAITDPDRLEPIRATLTAESDRRRSAQLLPRPGQTHVAKVAHSRRSGAPHPPWRRRKNTQPPMTSVLPDIHGGNLSNPSRQPLNEVLEAINRLLDRPTGQGVAAKSQDLVPSWVPATRARELYGDTAATNPAPAPARPTSASAGLLQIIRTPHQQIESDTTRPEAENARRRTGLER